MATVLLIEDDEAFAYAATKAIEEAGHRVIAKLDSLSGLLALDTERSIDLVVTDIRMPPGQPHGFAIGHMAHLRRPGLPIIYMTAFPELAEHGDEPDRVLYKPLENDALVNEINAQLGLRSSR
jgi:DNA-binding NtrC family response regulator